VKAKAINEEHLKVYSFGDQDLAIHVCDRPTGGNVGVSLLVGDLSELQVELEARHVPFDGPKEIHAGFRGLKLVDPDGNKVNLFQDRVHSTRSEP